MDIQIKATNLELTDSITDYVDKRMKAVEKFIDKKDTSVKCQVEVERSEGHQKADDMYRAEINLHIAGQDFRAESSEKRLFDAIDDIKQQITTELRRHKRKKRRSIRQGGAKIKALIKGFAK